MDSQQPGSSGLCRPSSRSTDRKTFRAFYFLAHNESDEEDDFDHIPHVSDHEDSDSSSSDDEVDRTSLPRDRPTVYRGRW